MTSGSEAQPIVTAERRMTPMRPSRSTAGFTLIELMVVVAIVAILAAIAVPAYGDAVRKSRRGQAKADLVEIAQRLERFHTVNNRYTGFWTSTFAGAPVPSPDQGTPAYLITIGATEAANAYTLTATPQGDQVKDVRCGVLTVNHLGLKAENGTGTTADCW